MDWRRINKEVIFLKNLQRSLLEEVKLATSDTKERNSISLILNTMYAPSKFFSKNPNSPNSYEPNLSYEHFF